MAPNKNYLAHPLTDQERSLLNAYVAEVGERAALSALGVSRQTLARVLAGLRVYGVTSNLIRERLAALDATGGHR